jgi:hypothetical protein
VHAEANALAASPITIPPPFAALPPTKSRLRFDMCLSFFLQDEDDEMPQTGAATRELEG